MVAHKRTSFQRENDLVEIAELYLRGLSQWRIAETINKSRGYHLTQQQISYDLNTLIERWKKVSIRAIDEQKAEELAKINQLERTYWEAWEKSLQPKTSTTEKNRQAFDGFVRPISSETKIEETTGNPAFLSGVMDCINKRCKLLGLDVVSSIEGTTGTQIIITGARRDEISEPSEPI